MPLCTQCPAIYPKDAFRLIDQSGAAIADPARSWWERLLRLLERTPLRADQATNRRVQYARDLQIRGAAWRCPRGHRQPADFREVESIVIGLIGPTATTKSTFLGSLLHQLTNRAILHRMGLSFSILDEASKERWLRNYDQQLRHRRAPETTLHPESHDAQTEPLVVRMDVAAEAGGPARFNLVFFDSAGELLQQGRAVALHNPFVQLMNAGLLFYTPKALEFPPDVYRIPGETRSQTAPGASHVVSTYTTLLGALTAHPANLGRHPSRDLPIAAVLSKCDELEELVEREFGSTITSLDLDETYFDHPVERHLQQGRLPYDITLRFGGAGILQAVRSLSRNTTYHLVSAMGCEPDENDVFADYRPINIAEPLLAVLVGLGRIGGRHDD